MRNRVSGYFCGLIYFECLSGLAILLDEVFLNALEGISSAVFLELHCISIYNQCRTLIKTVPQDGRNLCFSKYVLQQITEKSHLNSLPRLQFRDHVWAYTQRYLAIEAMEEAAAAMLGGEENEIKEEEVGEEMKLVQQLIACAEAVACRDKIHASALLSELRANAPVFGTSFQRVASCFVQGLSDRLALVQPLRAVGVVAKAKTVTLEKDQALSLVYAL
ncbi:hypothetical protein REPUB_Repub01dG0080200 [Reevesia pubescens]